MEKTFCRTCALTAFKIWKGWPTKDALSWTKQRQKMAHLPDLPRIEDGKTCPKCHSSQTISAINIFYKNVHGQFNTGLPDYFVLTIIENEIPNFLSKFGRPYADEAIGLIALEALEEHVQSLYPHS